MKILACGDIVGKKARKQILEKIPELRRQLGLDLVVVNAENAAHGFGITESMCQSLLEAGIDVLTMGNHTWDKRDIISFIDAEPRLIRPANYPEHTPGNGFCEVKLPDGRKALVIQLMGTLFIDPLDNPFTHIQKWLENHVLTQGYQAIVLDFHAEATSEKMAMGHFCDGKMSLVFGTHTHVPTADAMILDKGTAYITDVGMCGDYNSVLGMKAPEAVLRFTDKIRSEHLSPSEGEPTMCGVYVETDDYTGLAVKIEPVRIGGRLASALPMC